MPALLERPKMTRAMYEALKRHILREREKKKQAEQEQDAMMERLRKERELRKKKEEEDSLTLEQTNDQISQLEAKLETLKKQKSELFSQLKKVYQEEESRRRAQQKEQSELTITQASYQPPILTTLPQPMIMHGRPALYKPTASAPSGMKRQRSPSPPPTSSTTYQSYSHSEPKYLHTSSDSKYTLVDPKYPSHLDSKFVHADPKYLTTYVSSKPGQSAVLYTAQHPPPADFKGSAYQQPGISHLYAVTSASFQQQAAAAYSSGGGGKYVPTSQSAFKSYQSHPQKALAEQFSAAAYPIQRMQQPGYHASLQLQQSLDLPVSKPAGFDDKYKLGQAPIRGMVSSQQPALMNQALQLQQQQQQQQQQSKNAASFVAEYPSRAQPAVQGSAVPGSTYPASTGSTTYPSQSIGQGRPGYGTQSHGRFF